MQDALVGILGAVLIVGSMAATIEYTQTGASSSGDEVEGPPPRLGTSSWRATNCEAASLFWTPELSVLEEVVGPNYEPSPGPSPQPNTGLFWLFTFECGHASVNGLRVSPPSGGAALVAVQEPDDTRNVSAPDGWAAIPSWYGPEHSRVSDVVAEHGFNLTPAQTALGSSSSPLGDQVRMVIDSPTGHLEASVTVTGSTTQRTVQGALVGTDPDLFSVAYGPERMTRRSNGTATVETRGTTWVERLNLAANPYAIAYDTQMSWNFTLEDEPWSQSSNATNATTSRAPAVGPGVPGPSEWSLEAWRADRTSAS